MAVAYSQKSLWDIMKIKQALVLNVGILLGVLGAAGSCHAESTGVSAPTMYVVDMQRVLDESIAGKAARNTVSEEIKKREAKLQLARNELQRLSQELEKQSALLSEEAAVAKREQLARKERDFQRDVQDHQEDLARKNDEEISKIVRQAQTVIKEISDKRKLPFVLERGDGFVVFVKDEYDLTADIIKALDSKTLG